MAGALRIMTVHFIRAQPAESVPIRALRDAIRAVLARTSATEREHLRERVGLLLSVPPLRAALVDQIHGPMRPLAEEVAERKGRRPDDPAVRTLTGAMMGVGLSAMFAAVESPDADIVSLIDEVLAHLEAGLPCRHGPAGANVHPHATDLAAEQTPWTHLWFAIGWQAESSSRDRVT
jgi:MftR C-terminal domain